MASQMPHNTRTEDELVFKENEAGGKVDVLSDADANSLKS